MRNIEKLKLKILYNFFFFYPVAINLSYLWNFGIYALFCLIFQIITGIFLVMYYISDSVSAFLSVEYIMREVSYGWILRYLHANGASFFFLVIYVHIFRNLYFGSYLYPRIYIWYSGLIIYILLVITAFLGYVLPWGQMSYWAATVITNLVSVVPYIGDSLVIWLWGSYSVDNVTLHRFFSLHYFFPFIIVLCVVLHLIFLHEIGSSNPIGIEFKYIDYILFYPYYIYKDLFGLSIFFILYGFIVFFFPNYLGHYYNYIMANILVTPTHIVPEWYFLFFYAILRAIPDKMSGVIFMLMGIGVLFVIPFIIEFEVSSLLFRCLLRYFFWYLVFICLLLGWVGSKPAEEPYIFISQLCVVNYYIYFLVVLPYFSKIEDYFWINIYRK